MLTSMSVQELAQKARSKNEIYRILSSDCECSPLSDRLLSRQHLPASQGPL